MKLGHAKEVNSLCYGYTCCRKVLIPSPTYPQRLGMQQMLVLLGEQQRGLHQCQPAGQYWLSSSRSGEVAEHSGAGMSEPETD